MDSQTNNTDNLSILVEMKLFRQEVANQLQLFSEGVTEEINSLKEEIIKLGDKITSLKPNTANTEGGCNSQGENIDSEEVARIEIELIGNSDLHLQHSVVDKTIGNLNESSIADHDGTEISEPQSNNKLINIDGNENMRSILGSTSSNNKRRERILADSDVLPEVIAIEEDLEDTRTGTARNLSDRNKNVCEEDSILTDSDFVPEITAIEIHLDDSVKNLRSRSRSSNENIKTKVNNKPLNKELDLHETNESSLNDEVNNCEQSITLKKISNKHFQWQYCDNNIGSKRNLTKHTGIHAEEKPFKCQHCNKRFLRSCNLRQHVNIHTGEKPYKCQHCGISFSLANSRKQHIHNQHTRIYNREKTYKCQHCNKLFSRSSNLKEHVRVHTGEKPFKCQHCGKCFSQLGNLRKHVGIHTNVLTLKPQN